MVKPVSEKFKPRRDGWLEREGTWAEVTVGSLLAGHSNRTDIWEVIETVNPTQIEFGHTGWFRLRNQKNGECYSSPPRNRTYPVTFLMKDDEEEPPPRQPHSDADAVALLVEKLGAVEIATMNNATGEVLCPDYDGTMMKKSDTMTQGEEYMMHLEVAHGMDTSGLRAMPKDEMIIARIKAHGDAHNPIKPDVGHGGFPHRHVPERRGFKQDGDWE